VIGTGTGQREGKDGGEGRQEQRVGLKNLDLNCMTSKGIKKLITSCDKKKEKFTRHLVYFTASKLN
jgi:hypothetical protein